MPVLSGLERPILRRDHADTPGIRAPPVRPLPALAVTSLPAKGYAAKRSTLRARPVLRFVRCPFCPLYLLHRRHDPLPHGMAAVVAAIEHGVAPLGGFQIGVLARFAQDDVGGSVTFSVAAASGHRTLSPHLWRMLMTEYRERGLRDRHPAQQSQDRQSLGRGCADDYVYRLAHLQRRHSEPKSPLYCRDQDLSSVRSWQARGGAKKFRKTRARCQNRGPDQAGRRPCKRKLTADLEQWS